MVVLGINGLDEIIKPYNIVEFEADWSKNIVELADIIWRLARRGIVHLILINSSKYIDIDKLYSDLEPFLEDIRNVKIYWTQNIETLTYHLLLMDRVRSGEGFIVIILPYRRDYVSQVENTYIPKLKHSLRIASIRGWGIIIINPILHVEDPYVRSRVFLAEATLRILFGERNNYIVVINKSGLVKYSKIFK
jgi:hypothetical protein